MPRADLKGDVVTPTHLIENKMTSKGSYAFNRKEWNKIRSEAFRANKIPMFRIDFVNGPTVCVVDENEMTRLLSLECK